MILINMNLNNLMTVYFDKYLNLVGAYDSRASCQVAHRMNIMKQQTKYLKKQKDLTKLVRKIGK